MEFCGASGGAAMYEPTPSGLDQPGLADLFKVQYQRALVDLVLTPSPRPSGSRPIHRTAIIVGCLVGGIACITVIVGLGLCYRRQIRHCITGCEFPRQEMENHGRVFQETDYQVDFVHEMDVLERVVQEMGAEKIYWELPAENKPAEIWSSTKGSEENPGSDDVRRNGMPADVEVPEIPSPGRTSEGSSRGSQRSFKMLHPLPMP